MSTAPRSYQNGTVSSRIYPRGTASSKILHNGYVSVGRSSQNEYYAEQLKAHFNQLEHHGNDIVELNVGGCAYATTYLALAESKSPFFTSLFRMNNETGRVIEISDSVTKDKAGRIFINRDGDLFRYILQYLRDGCRVALPNDLNILKMLRREAEFFSLLNFIKLVDDLMTQQLAASSSHRNSQVNDELIELIRKLSQQLSVNTFTQLNGIPR